MSTLEGLRSTKRTRKQMLKLYAKAEPAMELIEGLAEEMNFTNMQVYKWLCE